MLLRFPDVQAAEWPSKTSLHPAWSLGSKQKHGFPVPQGKSIKESAKLLCTGVTGVSKWKGKWKSFKLEKGIYVYVYMMIYMIIHIVIIPEVFCSQFGVSVQCQKPNVADPANDCFIAWDQELAFVPKHRRRQHLQAYAWSTCVRKQSCTWHIDRTWAHDAFEKCKCASS